MYYQQHNIAHSYLRCITNCLYASCRVRLGYLVLLDQEGWMGSRAWLALRDQLVLKAPRVSRDRRWHPSWCNSIRWLLSVRAEVCSKRRRDIKWCVWAFSYGCAQIGGWFSKEKFGTLHETSYITEQKMSAVRGAWVEPKINLLFLTVLTIKVRHKRVI